MEIVRIFVDEESLEGLYAMKYDGEACDEFERLFESWTDVKYLRHYLIYNNKYLNSDYFKHLYPDEIETEILDEAEELEKLLKSYATNKDIGNLQMLFRPLSKTANINPPPLEKTKASIRDRKNFPKNILRIYALRLGENTFVITGGAIKLVNEMKDHVDTQRELDKLDIARDFLTKNNLNSDEDLTLYYG